MEIDIDSVSDIFLFLTIVVRMMAPFEIPEIKRKGGIYICGHVFFFCFVTRKSIATLTYADVVAHLTPNLVKCFKYTFRNIRFWMHGGTTLLSSERAL